MLRSGDLLMEFSMTDRRLEGTRVHQMLQESRPEEYKKEMPVSLQVDRGNYLLDIGGRVDGIYRYPDRVIIEEIKSTTRDLNKYRRDALPGEEDSGGQPRESSPRHWGQLKVYCYIYALQEELEQIDARLTYFQVNSEETLELDRCYTRQELETFFYDLVDRFLTWAETLDQWRSQRNETAEQLKFPFGSYRPGQHKMAVVIYRTIEAGAGPAGEIDERAAVPLNDTGGTSGTPPVNGAVGNGQLIVQAPTGIGKTMAALFPTVKALGRDLCGKIFYLTARTTVKAVAEKALQEMRDKGLKMKSLTLTAKEKTCFNPESACDPEECEFARGYYDRVDDAVEEIFRQDAFTREAVEAMARKHMVCPFEFALELAITADCIICDYNYAFDPSVCLKRFFGEEGPEEDYVFLIDEAHNLVNRSREMFSAGLFKQPFVELRRTLKSKLPGVYKSMGKINTFLRQCWKRCEEEGRPVVEKEEPEDIYPLLRKFSKAAEDWLALNLKTSFRDELLDMYFEVSRFLRTAEQYDETYATYYEPKGRDLRLKLFCIDPSRQLAEALSRCKSAVFFSATMTPSAYFRQIFGCRDTAGELILPSPFPPENLCLMVSDRISTLYRQRERTKEAVNRVIVSLVNHSSGNYLLFFPSYRYMEMVYELFAAEMETRPETEIIVQTPGMTEPERDIFLQNFDDGGSEGSTLVGFAVMGGIFGEGIDLVGDRLSGAVIVGVGLPAISLENELIKDYFRDPERGGSGFEYAYLYPGINRVLQAAGRVIRSEEDRGVILLIDERFSWRQYSSLFPREWRPMRASDREQLSQILDQFRGPTRVGGQ